MDPAVGTAPRHPLLRWRWLVVALSLVIVMIAVGTWWFVGGTRVAGGGGFSQGVPGEVAKRWHVGIPLEIEGDGSVRLVSAHVLGAKKMEPVEVRLVRTLTPLGLGGMSGELDPALYAAVPLRDAVVSGHGPGVHWWIDVTGTPEQVGLRRYPGVELTYRSGPRIRTFRFAVRICVDARPAGAPVQNNC